LPALLPPVEMSFSVIASVGNDTFVT